MNNKEMVREALSAEKMEQVSGGLVDGCACPYESRSQLIEQKQRAVLAEMQQKMEQTADIRMRASEDALKGAMRINRQEADIKEAMRAQREALGLN